MIDRSNTDVADRLEDAAALLKGQGANSFRVRAYSRAAQTLRQLDEPVQSILDREGVEGLERLPGVGPRLSARLHDEVGLETLEDLEAAAHDGRLEDISGFGHKRLAGIRDVLAHRLPRIRPTTAPAAEPPSVAELLDVDREYREAAASDRLPKITPRRFNPERRQWLPILHTNRHDRHYTALFSNTARAHRLGRTEDWVVIYCDRGAVDGQWTVVTDHGRSLAGRRVVRGREEECARHYGLVAA